MSKESHRAYIEAAARKKATKAIKKNPNLSRDELRALRIQTLEPWKRIITGSISLTVLLIGIYLSRSDTSAYGPWLVGIGIVGMLAAVFGWLKTLEHVFDAIDVADILDGIL